MKAPAAALLALVIMLTGCGSGADRVVVAAGTTLVDSGILDEIVAAYEAAHPGAELSVVGDSTAQVLELGRRGAADLLLTHAPVLEEAFIAAGGAARVEPVLASRFVLLAPPGSVAGLAGLAPEEVLAEAARTSQPFVSRGDGSGTHAKELELWAAAGIDPAGADWYLETGQGMGLTIQVAEGRGALTLAEEGSFLAGAGALSLEPIAVSPGAVPMTNPYRALVVAGGAETSAGEFLHWLLSPDGRAAIEAANRSRFGRVVYGPVGQ